MITSSMKRMVKLLIRSQQTSVGEWMSNFIPHFTRHVLFYPCWNSSGHHSELLVRHLVILITHGRMSLAGYLSALPVLLDILCPIWITAIGAGSHVNIKHRHWCLCATSMIGMKHNIKCGLRQGELNPLWCNSTDEGYIQCVCYFCYYFLSVCGVSIFSVVGNVLIIQAMVTHRWVPGDIWYRRDMVMLSALLAICEGKPQVLGDFPLHTQRASNAKLQCFCAVVWTICSTKYRVVGDLRCHKGHEMSFWSKCPMKYQDVLVRFLLFWDIR